MHVPAPASSAATRSQTSALREEMYTRAPASTNPRAIIRPMPREPPVTSAVLPATENRSCIGVSFSGAKDSRGAAGKGRAVARVAGRPAGR